MSQDNASGEAHIRYYMPNFSVRILERVGPQTREAVFARTPSTLRSAPSRTRQRTTGRLATPSDGRAVAAKRRRTTPRARARVLCHMTERCVGAIRRRTSALPLSVGCFQSSGVTGSNRNVICLLFCPCVLSYVNHLYFICSVENAE